MKKFGKSIWTRALAVVLCALSGVGLVVSVLTTVFFAEMGGTEEIYNTVYSEIADGYAMYAVNELEVGNTNALAEYLNDKGIACTITKESAGSGGSFILFNSVYVSFSSAVCKKAFYFIQNNVPDILRNITLPHPLVCQTSQIHINPLCDFFIYSRIFKNFHNKLRRIFLGCKQLLFSIF